MEKTLLVFDANHGVMPDSGTAWGNFSAFSLDEPVAVRDCYGRQIPSYSCYPDVAQQLKDSGSLPCFVKIKFTIRSSKYFGISAELMPETNQKILDFFSKFPHNDAMSFFVFGARYINFNGNSFGKVFALNIFDAQQESIYKIQTLRSDPTLVQQIGRECSFPAVFDFDLDVQIVQNKPQACISGYKYQKNTFGKFDDFLGTVFRNNTSSADKAA